MRSALFPVQSLSVYSRDVPAPGRPRRFPSERRQGIAVLLIHHAGTNGRQRGTSRREDALDTVIALRRPEDHSARFEVHFETAKSG
jgi:hypothetical protein